ncbi:MAG: 2Fe-2S iron-sulfur cluster binding domain-containing protein, partial [Anaerolineae bacterium]|nr:2Fe-2S iron-sulfur cluster binding domain-containing protein [Anaerolineae bacterium]
MNVNSTNPASISVTVNGRLVTGEIDESRTLSDFLRLDLGLTGTKIGCNEAECGICTVLVDGVPVNSCIYPALRADGTQVTTIEGLAQEGALDPLQDQFIKHGAVQCGFCTPGLIMTAKALLNQDDNPSEDGIKHALKDTYCRCTGYTSVIRAIQSAAAVKRGEGAIEPQITEGEHEDLRVVGQSLPSQEAVAKVTGTARYTDDYNFPMMLYARTLRAAYPHARILNINTEAAKALPGV